MAIMVDEEDIKMSGRVQRAFKNRDNAEWREAYFDTGTHAGHADPAERLRHERHVAAVQDLQDELQREAAAAQYRAGLGSQSGGSKQQIEIAIQQAMASPAFGDGKHKDHAAQVEYISGLYRQLHANK